MPSFFVAVDMPDTCYPVEAMYWLALGRVPEVDHWGSDVDIRVDKEAILEREGTIPIRFDFSELEFRWMKIEIDYERYLKAQNECFHYDRDKDVSEQVKRWVDMRPADHLSPAEKDELKGDIAAFITEIERHYREGQWAEAMESKFDRVLDIAWARIFQKLASGELKALGWLRDGELTDNFDADQIDFIDIPAEAWTLKAFDRRNSVLSLESGGEYQSVQLSTDDVLRLFPEPATAPIPVSGKAYPGVVILDELDEREDRSDKRDGLVSTNTPRPRGPRPRGHGTDQRSVVRNLYEKKWLEDDEKQDALITDIQDFCKRAFGDKIPPGRSTIQSWFPKRIKKPVIQAGNSREKGPLIAGAKG
ncbi:hypothetical protein NKI80_07325 [Mesorhizobium sp. M0387]|uniref:hypothetical protein n=1 Tax=Mesorhizobium sp. M0387 TaxID=2956940 RepID=UPI00333D9281